MKEQKKRNVSRRIRTISEKNFYELWTLAEKEESSAQFVRDVMHPESKYHLLYRKYDIEYKYFIDMLHNIHRLAKISVKEIVEQSGMRKATVAQIMCIPIPTFDNWYYGRTECPGYMRLSLLRYFKMFSLGHHIYIAAEEPKPVTKKEILEVINNISEPEEESGVKDEDLPLISREWYESTRDSMKSWEQEHVHSGNNEVQELLERLKYLDRFSTSDE